MVRTRNNYLPDFVGNALRGVPGPAECHGGRSLQGNRRIVALTVGELNHAVVLTRNLKGTGTVVRGSSYPAHSGETFGHLLARSGDRATTRETTAARSSPGFRGVLSPRTRRAASSACGARPYRRPSNFIAALMGIGLVESPSMSRQSGKSLRCQHWAFRMSPGFERRQQCDHVLRHDVADHRNHAAGADRQQRQGQAVVAAENGQIGHGHDLRRPDPSNRSLL